MRLAPGLAYILIILLLMQGCGSKTNPDAIFTALENKSTGLDFENALHPTDSFNVFDYMYYYNGAGVAAGDFNNDGLTDLFFAANQGDDKLYLNEGGLHF